MLHQFLGSLAVTWWDETMHVRRISDQCFGTKRTENVCKPVLTAGSGSQGWGTGKGEGWPDWLPWTARPAAPRHAPKLDDAPGHGWPGHGPVQHSGHSRHHLVEDKGLG